MRDRGGEEGGREGRKGGGGERERDSECARVRVRGLEHVSERASECLHLLV